MGTKMEKGVKGKTKGREYLTTGSSGGASKDPRPEDVALICPLRRLVNFELKFIFYWSNGVMEKPKPRTSLGSSNHLNVWP